MKKFLSYASHYNFKNYNNEVINTIVKDIQSPKIDVKQSNVNNFMLTNSYYNKFKSFLQEETRLLQPEIINNNYNVSDCKETPHEYIKTINSCRMISFILRNLENNYKLTEIDIIIYKTITTHFKMSSNMIFGNYKNIKVNDFRSFPCLAFDVLEKPKKTNPDEMRYFYNFDFKGKVYMFILEQYIRFVCKEKGIKFTFDKDFINKQNTKDYMNEIISECKTKYNTHNILHFDISKAFDSVSVDLIKESFDHFFPSNPEIFKNIMASFYVFPICNKFVDKDGGIHFFQDNIKIKNGILTGLNLSKIIFQIVMNYLLRHLNENKNEIKVFVDDIIIISQKSCVPFYNSITSTLNLYSLKINYAKNQINVDPLNSFPNCKKFNKDNLLFNQNINPNEEKEDKEDKNSSIIIDEINTIKQDLKEIKEFIKEFNERKKHFGYSLNRSLTNLQPQNTRTTEIENDVFS